MQLLLLCYQPSCRKGFTFTTTSCSLQLTQHILTFRARRILMKTNFVVCWCKFANDFFCKIVAHGSLICRWYYWKIFAVNFYMSCFDCREDSIGKKLIRLNWEKAVYQLVFMLANTLINIVNCFYHYRSWINNGFNFSKQSTLSLHRDSYCVFLLGMKEWF